MISTVCRCRCARRRCLRILSSLLRLLFLLFQEWVELIDINRVQWISPMTIQAANFTFTRARQRTSHTRARWPPHLLRICDVAFDFVQFFRWPGIRFKIDRRFDFARMIDDFHRAMLEYAEIISCSSEWMKSLTYSNQSRPTTMLWIVHVTLSHVYTSRCLAEDELQTKKCDPNFSYRFNSKTSKPLGFTSIFLTENFAFGKILP